MGKAPAMACHSSPPPLFCMKHVEQAIGWIRWRIFVHEFLRLQGSHGVEIEDEFVGRRHRHSHLIHVIHGFAPQIPAGLEKEYAGIVEGWASGVSWQELIENSGMDEGDIARLLCHSLDLLEQDIGLIFPRFVWSKGDLLLPSSNQSTYRCSHYLENVITSTIEVLKNGPRVMVYRLRRNCLDQQMAHAKLTVLVLDILHSFFMLYIVDGLVPSFKMTCKTLRTGLALRSLG